jgi:hypothetical protein
MLHTIPSIGTIRPTPERRDLACIVQPVKVTEMRARVLAVAAALLTSHCLAAAAQSARTDPFDFLRPTIQFSSDDRRQLDDRAIVLRILPASGQELATMVASSLNIDPDAFIAKVRNIPALKKGANVPQIAKFSTPPKIEDLQQLTLDDSDIDAIARCRPTRCALKLTGPEIERLHRAKVPDAAASHAAVEQEFRQIVLERAKNYLASGIQDGQPQFLTLMSHSPYIARAPELASYLERYPQAPLPRAESFLYWSKETYAWNPMITVTQVTIVRGNGEGPLPEVLVVSRDIFATRYTGGSLVLSALIRDPDAPANRRYLVYVNRTWADGLRGLWRPFVEYRVKSQAKKVFASVRDRLEQTSPISTQ